MGTLNLIERDSCLQPVTRPAFWRRQFAPQITHPQIVFDIVFGIVEIQERRFAPPSESDNQSDADAEG